MFCHCFADGTVTMHFLMGSNSSGPVVELSRYLTQEVCDRPDLHAECPIIKSNFILSSDSCRIFRVCNRNRTHKCNSMLCCVGWLFSGLLWTAVGSAGGYVSPDLLWIKPIFVGCFGFFYFYFFAVICEKVSAHSCGPCAWVWLFIFVLCCCISVFVPLRFTGLCHRCRILRFLKNARYNSCALRLKKKKRKPTKKRLGSE